MFRLCWQPSDNIEDFVLDSYVVTILNVTNMAEISTQNVTENCLDLNLASGNYLFSYHVISMCGTTSDIRNDTLHIATQECVCKCTCKLCM